MKTCPRCGHENPDTATLCEQCHETLSAPDSAVQTTSQPPTEEPPDAPPGGVPVWPSGGRPAQESPPPVAPIASSRPSFWTENGPYLWGLGLGLIPAILWFLAASVATQGNQDLGQGISLFVLGLGLYGVELVVMIICLVNKPSRLFGYGLLTMMLIAPVVAAMSCGIAFRPH
jgi:zinc-ribbon domain